MEDGSRKADDDRAFIGFYTDPAVKEEAERRASAEGVSLSEWMRRRLREAGYNRRDELAAA